MGKGTQQQVVIRFQICIFDILNTAVEGKFSSEKSL